MEVKFCRRCGTTVNQKNETEYVCKRGHRLFYASVPAMGVFLVNEQNKVLLITRGEDPGKGMLDAPGGFCDARENLEEAIARELREELGVEPEQYGDLDFLCSRVNEYEFAGEMIHPLDFFFWARVNGSLHVQPGDDAAAADWYDPKDVSLDDLAFISARYAFVQLKKHLT